MSSMFDYGRDKSSNTYTYQFLQPNLQPGYYPVDNFQGMVHYKEQQMSPFGIPVWGEISYSKPLTPDQCNLYEFVEKPVQAVSPVHESKIESPVVSVEQERVPENVVIHHVKGNRIFDSKNKDYKLISMRYPESDTGYCNYAVPSEQVSLNADGTYDIIIGTEGQMRNVSILKGGKPSFPVMSASEVADLYQRTLTPNHGEKLAFLGSVDRKFVQATKNPAYKVVSVPYSGSENHYAKITVPTANIADAVAGGKSIPGRVNVTIGVESGNVPVSIKKGGSFVRMMMPTSELVQLQKDAVSSWQRRSLQNAQSIAEQDVGFGDDFALE